MARRKKTGSGKVTCAVVIGFLVLLAVVPRGVCIGAGVLVIVAMYFLRKSDNRAATEPKKEGPVRPTLRPERRTAISANRGKVAGAVNRFVKDDEPRSVMSGQPPAASSFRVPIAPVGFGQAKWVPAGETVTVAGISIPGGLIYVGTSLTTPSGANDPCLIDPSKSVASNGDFTEPPMGYWPSYSAIPASARRAYLKWLSGGRRDPEAAIGYVFIFFYGLERRAILDAAMDDAAKADLPLIAAELRRLLGIYGEKSGSFRSYAGSLLSWVSLAEQPDKAYLKPIPSFPLTYELPVYIRAALGQAAIDRAPMPARLALAWVKLDPTTNLRTPATRCGAEFDQLFVRKYQEVFGEGMVVPMCRTRLKLVYRPASAGFRGYEDICLTFGDTPDVTVLTAPIKKLQQVVEVTTKELEPFSRYVGKHPDAKHALAGLIQLPVTLWPEEAQTSILDLRAQLDRGMLLMSLQELFTILDATAKITRETTLGLARTLESLNIGIEPDVLDCAKLPKSNETVVLFAVPAGDAARRSTPSFRAAALTLQLASAVAAADGEFGSEEMSHLEAQVQTWTHLTASHIHRLLAHLRLLMVAPASLAALTKRLEPLDSAAKESIAGFMATVAQSDGMVTPAEVIMLEKVYKALGVDPKKVFADIHAAAAGATPTATATAQVEETGFILDPARIAALQRDTEAVSALLSTIFMEEEPHVPAPIEPEPDADAVPSGLLGLDEAHSALARLLLSRPEWTKGELNDAAADLDLMVDGAIETLNEAAFDKHEVPFVEGDDPVMVNPELLEMLAA